MLGQTWKSEIRTYKDEKTGRAVHQLTRTGNNVHLYFTENSFDSNKNEIIFLSDRASGEDKLSHEFPHYNLFRMNLDNGEITQITDESTVPLSEPTRFGSVSSVTKTPDSEIIVYKTGYQFYKQLFHYLAF